MADARYCGRCKLIVGDHPLGHCTCPEPAAPQLSRWDLVVKVAEANDRASDAEQRLFSLQSALEGEIERLRERAWDTDRHPYVRAEDLSTCHRLKELLGTRRLDESREEKP